MRHGARRCLSTQRGVGSFRPILQHPEYYLIAARTLQVEKWIVRRNGPITAGEYFLLKRRLRLCEGSHASCRLGCARAAEPWSVIARSRDFRCPEALRKNTTVNRDLSEILPATTRRRRDLAPKLPTSLRSRGNPARRCGNRSQPYQAGQLVRCGLAVLEFRRPRSFAGAWIPTSFCARYLPEAAGEFSAT